MSHWPGLSAWRRNEALPRMSGLHEQSQTPQSGEGGLLLYFFIFFPSLASFLLRHKVAIERHSFLSLCQKKKCLAGPSLGRHGSALELTRVAG